MLPPSSSGLAFEKKREARSPKNFQSLVTFLRVPVPRTDSRRELLGSVLSCQSVGRKASYRLARRQPLLSVLALTATLPAVSDHFHARDTLGTKKTHLQRDTGSDRNGSDSTRTTRKSRQEKRRRKEGPLQQLQLQCWSWLHQQTAKVHTGSGSGEKGQPTGSPPPPPTADGRRATTVAKTASCTLTAANWSPEKKLRPFKNRQ